MTTLRPGYTISFLRKMSLDFTLTTNSPADETSISKNTINYYPSLTEDSSTCGETSEDSTLDSSSRCSSTSKTREGVIANDSSSPVLFLNFPHVNDKERIACEIECHASTIMQGTWTAEGVVITRFSDGHAATIIQGIWHQWFKKEKDKRQMKKELNASQIVLNAWRRWSMREKARKDETAAHIVQDAWRVWFTAEKQRQLVRNENIAAITIQINWLNFYVREKTKKEENAAQIIQDAWCLWITAENDRQKVTIENLAVVTIQKYWKNYSAKISTMKAIKKKGAESARTQNMVFAMGVAAISQSLLHTYFSG